MMPKREFKFPQAVRDDWARRQREYRTRKKLKAKKEEMKSGK